jgi:DNA-directed RNA polymerase subunit RPC12/RpoP
MNSDVAEMINEISGSPFGGEHSMTITQEGQTAQVSMQWGLGIGAIYFILSGIILIIAGILEIRAKKIFFETKKPITTKKPAVPPPAKKPEKPAEKTKSSEDIFCPECGNKLKKDDMFCPECGKKL